MRPQVLDGPVDAAEAAVMRAQAEGVPFIVGSPAAMELQRTLRTVALAVDGCVANTGIGPAA